MRSTPSNGLCLRNGVLMFMPAWTERDAGKQAHKGGGRNQQRGNIRRDGEGEGGGVARRKREQGGEKSFYSGFVRFNFQSEYTQREGKSLIR